MTGGRLIWRWQHPLGVEELTERAMRGDLELLDDLADIDDEAASELMTIAASYGRWDLVIGLVDAGAAVPVGGTTPVHIAAGAGELDVVMLLVEHGADLTARDPEFGATPVNWARFLDQPEVTAWLERNATAE